METQNRHKGNNQPRAQTGKAEEGNMFSHFKVLAHLVWHCVQKSLSAAPRGSIMEWVTLSGWESFPRKGVPSMTHPLPSGEPDRGKEAESHHR